MSILRMGSLLCIQQLNGRRPGVTVCVRGWGQVAQTCRHESESFGQSKIAVDDTLGFLEDSSLSEGQRHSSSLKTNFDCIFTRQCLSVIVKP